VTFSIALGADELEPVALEFEARPARLLRSGRKLREATSRMVRATGRRESSALADGDIKRGSDRLVAAHAAILSRRAPQ